MRKHWIDFLFEITDEDSEKYGERFFVEVETGLNAEKEAWIIAREIFHQTEKELIGVFTPSEAENIGYDTF